MLFVSDENERERRTLNSSGREWFGSYCANDTHAWVTVTVTDTRNTSKLGPYRLDKAEREEKAHLLT